MQRRTLPVALAFATSASLLLSACGGRDEKAGDNDKIAGADQGEEKPSELAKPSQAPAQDRPDGVDVSLPDYFKLIMVKLPTGDDLWQASKAFVEAKAAKCQ